MTKHNNKLVNYRKDFIVDFFRKLFSGKFSKVFFQMDRIEKLRCALGITFENSPNAHLIWQIDHVDHRKIVLSNQNFYDSSGGCPRPDIQHATPTFHGSGHPLAKR